MTHQKADRFCLVSGAEQGFTSVEAAVGVARLALAEATTAAWVLARQLADTARVVATITDTGAAVTNGSIR
jgi:hypothetical protein